MQYLGDMFVKLFKILTISKYQVKENLNEF